jgi:hypothetical protein
LTLFLLIPPVAVAKKLILEISCPDSVTTETQVTVGIHIENESCQDIDVRISSGIAGNSNNTILGMTARGPKTIDGATFDYTVPGATDFLPGTCNTSTDRCDGSADTVYCNFDGDCICNLTTAGVLDLSMPLPAVVPSSVADTVISQYVLMNWDEAKQWTGDQCAIEVPEPSALIQLFSELLGLAALSRHRRRRADPSRKHRAKSGSTETLEEKLK